jgi:hypothetical protein
VHYGGAAAGISQGILVVPLNLSNAFSVQKILLYFHGKTFEIPAFSN